MKKFNLNDYILVQITDYGWQELEKYEERTGNTGFVENCIKSEKVIIDGNDWYKFQAHFVITTFGIIPFYSNPSPIKSNILIPENTDKQ